MIFLLNCAIKVSLILVVTLIAVRLLRRQSAALRHCALAAGNFFCRDYTWHEPPDSRMDMEVRRGASATAARVLGRIRERFTNVSFLYSDAFAAAFSD